MPRNEGDRAESYVTVAGRRERIYPAWMFRFAWFVVAGGVWFGFFGLGGRSTRDFDLRALAIILPAATLIGASIFHWLTHPTGIKDTWSGGSISLTGKNPYQLAWSDWALLFTHAGHIDRRAAIVKVEKRFLMGLISLGSVVKSLREFNEVFLIEKVHTTRRGKRTLFHDSRRTVETHLTLTLSLSNSVGENVKLMDLNTALDGARGKQFMQELKTEIESVIAALPAVTKPGVGRAANG